jgi:hypothetical protein
MLGKKFNCFSMVFKHSLLEWIYEDENNLKTSYAADQQFVLMGTLSPNM